MLVWYGFYMRAINVSELIFTATRKYCASVNGIVFMPVVTNQCTLVSVSDPLRCVFLTLHAPFHPGLINVLYSTHVCVRVI